MVFSYYKKLSAPQKRIYEQSDAIISVHLPDAGELLQLIPLLSSALAQEDREQVEAICRKLTLGMANRLAVPPLRVKVLAVRPSASWGELHGLYEPAEGRAQGVPREDRTMLHQAAQEGEEQRPQQQGQDGARQGRQPEVQRGGR